MARDATSSSTPTHTLSELGITTTTDASGQEQLYIQLDAAHSATEKASRLAFDTTTKTWNFEQDVSNTNNHKDVERSKDHKSEDDAAHLPFWITHLPKTEYTSFFCNADWAATPLGPLESWPVILQTFVAFLMKDNMAAAMYWGPELCSIFNPGMASLVSVRLQKDRDTILGRVFPELWSEVWVRMKPVLEHVKETGEPVDAIELDLYPTADGRVEETFWTAAFMSIRGPDGKFLGYYNRGREITKEVLVERRTKTLTEIASSSELEGEFVWDHLFDAFRANERDFPMAFAYRAIEDPEAGRCRLELKQSIGLPQDGHPLVPATCDLYEAHDGFFPLYRRAKPLDKPLILHRSNNTLSEHILQGFEWRGFEEPCRSIAVIAIRSSDRMLGILVVGLNPRRPVDTDYEGFLNSLSRHASATVINAIDREEAKLRAERLSKQLRASEAQIRDMAVYGPVGMLRLATNGKILWANDQFYEITGHGRLDEHQYELSFVDVVDPEDQPLSAAEWPKLIEDRGKVDVALRLKRKWQPPSSSLDGAEAEEPAWINAIAYPIIEDDEVKGVAAAVTDISHFKWAEATQRRHAAAAKEAQRLQENFIDIVSHEMRNPLSAITQLADEISSSLEITPNTDDPVALDIIKSNVSSAKTILLCAAHQKRIVDDVLTLSKLESMMLSITPVVVQPSTVVETVIKMFDGEITTNKIHFTSVVDESYAQAGTDWVCIDPSRLSQILINLIGNAIKFTKTEERRMIRIRTGAAATRPPTLAGVKWLPTEKPYRDPTNAPDWGDGDPVFLCFEIEDTGRGLEKEEMKQLFGKFQQATAKTHIKYGGSGLGLFISRELTETQGGEIGVESKPGMGSIFAFYIKGRHAEAPDEPAKIKTPPLPTHILETPKSGLDPIEEPPRATTPAAAEKYDQLTVLLVEDNVVNAQVLTRQLERSNVKVHAANHGVEALDFLRTTRAWADTTTSSTTPPVPSNELLHIDFILMDVEMPVMDGLTCTRRIRQLEQQGVLQGHTNIIAITANARQEQIETILQAGMDDVMSKPFRVKDLLKRMDTIRHHHHHPS